MSLLKINLLESFPNIKRDIKSRLINKDENRRINRKHNLIINYTLFNDGCTSEREKSGEIFDLYLNTTSFGLFLDCVECNSRLCAV